MSFTGKEKTGGGRDLPWKITGSLSQAECNKDRNGGVK